MYWEKHNANNKWRETTEVLEVAKQKNIKTLGAERIRKAFDIIW